jgi:hypothetical protein
MSDTLLERLRAAATRAPTCRYPRGQRGGVCGAPATHERQWSIHTVRMRGDRTFHWRPCCERHAGRASVVRLYTRAGEIHGFSPESVERGLETMRDAAPCWRHKPNEGVMDLERNAKLFCGECWSSMVEAFLHGAREGT